MRFNPFWVILALVLMPWFIAPLLVLMLVLFLAAALLLHPGVSFGPRGFVRHVADDLWNLFVGKKRRADFALFHATANILSLRGPMPQGRGAEDGFVLLGANDAGEVYEAALQALARLKGGEKELAIYGACRTFRVLSGISVTLLLAAFLGTVSGPGALLAPIAGYFSASPLSPAVQRLFLSGASVEGLAVEGVSPEPGDAASLSGVLRVPVGVKVTTSILSSVIEAEILQE